MEEEITSLRKNYNEDEINNDDIENDKISNDENDNEFFNHSTNKIKADDNHIAADNESINQKEDDNPEDKENDIVFEEFESPFLHILKTFLSKKNLSFSNFNQLKVFLENKVNEEKKDEFCSLVGEEFIEFIDNYNVFNGIDYSYHYLKDVRPQISFVYDIPDVESMHELTNNLYKLPDEVSKLYKEAEKLNAKSVPKINIKNLKVSSILSSLKGVIFKMAKENISSRLGEDNKYMSLCMNISQTKSLVQNLKKKVNVKSLTKMVKKEIKSQVKQAKRKIKNAAVDQLNKIKDEALEKYGIDINKLKNLQSINFSDLSNLNLAEIQNNIKAITDKANIDSSLINKLSLDDIKNIDFSNLNSLSDLEEKFREIQEKTINLKNEVSDTIEEKKKELSEIKEDIGIIRDSVVEEMDNKKQQFNEAQEALNNNIQEIKETALHVTQEVDKIKEELSDLNQEKIKEKFNEQIEAQKQNFMEMLKAWKDQLIENIKDYIFKTKEEREEAAKERERKIKEAEEINIDPAVEKEKMIKQYQSILSELFKNMDQISSFAFNLVLLPIFNNLHDDSIQDASHSDNLVQSNTKHQNSFNSNNYSVHSKKLNKNEVFFHFISFFSATVCFFTNLNSKYYIDELEKFNVDFYLEEEKTDFLAAKLHYSLNYRVFYKNKITANKSLEPYELNKKEIIDLNNIKRSVFLYGELNKNYSAEMDSYEIIEAKKNQQAKIPPLSVYDNPMFHPPYDEYKYDVSNRNFYRRYDNLDRLHLCEKCYYVKENPDIPEPECSTIYREIDKTRLVTIEIQSIIDVTKINEEILEEEFSYSNILNRIIIMHNYKAFNLDSTKILKTCIMNPILNVEVSSLIDKFRNLFGEELAFYFIWISHFISYLYFPAALGIIVFLLCQFSQIYFGEDYYIENKVDLWIKFPFTFIVMVWAKIYIDSWNKVEKIYNYEWGMNDYCVENSALKSCKKFNKFLNVEMPIIDTNEANFRQIVSWSITIIMLLLVIGSNKVVFYISDFIKLNFASTVEKYNLTQYLAPFSLFIIRQLNTQVYESISENLSNWEIHATVSDKRNSQVIKSIAFQFFNYYFNLYYIAFYKNLSDTCEYGNCKIELETQVTVILISAILNDMISIIYFQFFASRHILNKIKQLKKRIIQQEIVNNIDDDSNTENHRFLIKDESSKHNYYVRKVYEDANADKEYIDVTLSFGYVIQFGSSSPICFFLCLVQAILARVADALKLGVFEHVNFSNGSKGIGPHSKIISFMITLGVITTLYINFISDNRMNVYSFSARFSIIIAIENIVFVMLMFMELQKLPLWFNFKDQIKVSYYNFMKSNVIINNSGEEDEN